MPQYFQNRLAHIEHLQELLKIQRVHIECLQIADRCRLQIHDFHAQQGTGQNVSESLILHEKLYLCNDFPIFLDFIKEKEGLSGDDFLITVQRQLQNQVIYACRTAQNAHNFRLSDQIELDVVATCRPQALTDDKRLPRLTDTINQQSFVAAVDPVHNILFNFSFQHLQYLHIQFVHFLMILYSCFDIFSRE